MLFTRLVQHGFFNVLSYKIQENLPVGSTVHNVLVPLTSIIKNKKTAPRPIWLVYRPMWWNHYLNWSYFSQIALACYADKKKKPTQYSVCLCICAEVHVCMCVFIQVQLEIRGQPQMSFLRIHILIYYPVTLICSWTFLDHQPPNNGIETYYQWWKFGV